MGARPRWDFIRRKWLHVIINDDFLEEGWGGGGVTKEHSYLLLSALADYASLLSIYSISDNCVRESTLWLSG